MAAEDADRRAIAVEAHFVELMAAMQSPRIQVERREDVLVLKSDLPLPLCNGAVDPRFGGPDAMARIDRLAGELIDHGQPFQVWLGSSSRPEGIGERLAAQGFVLEATPGMHRFLDAGPVPEPPRSGLEVRRSATPEERTAGVGLFCSVFGVPAALGADLERALFTQDEAEVVDVTAWDDGRLVGTGCLAVVDGVSGLYNIAVADDARGRGIGRAVTVELLRLATATGGSEVILHATELGFPVYRRLGFETVTTIQTAVWLPPGAGPES